MVGWLLQLLSVSFLKSGLGHRENRVQAAQGIG